MFELIAEFLVLSSRENLINLNQLLSKDAKLNLFGAHGLFCSSAINTEENKISGFNKLFDDDKESVLSEAEEDTLDFEVPFISAWLRARFDQNLTVNPLVDYDLMLDVTQLTLTLEQQINLRQWCHGYLIGVNPSWHNAEFDRLLLPVTTLAQELPTDRLCEEKLTELIHQIPNTLTAIYRYFFKLPITQYFLPVATVPKLGRNEPCYCGSGIKFKKCCYV